MQILQIFLEAILKWLHIIIISKSDYSVGFYAAKHVKYMKTLRLIVGWINEQRQTRRRREDSILGNILTYFDTFFHADKEYCEN